MQHAQLDLHFIIGTTCSFKISMKYVKSVGQDFFRKLRNLVKHSRIQTLDY